MLYRERNFFLQVSVLVCLGIIGGLVYHNYSTVVSKSKDLGDKIDDIDVSCPKCPEVATDDEEESSKCPSAQDIAEAVFPGRNTGVTQAGKYFDIHSDESYELLPEYSFFQPERAFPEDSLLDRPLRDANVKVPQNKIDNSIDGGTIDTQRSASMNGSQTRMDDRTAYQRSIDARMARGLQMGSGSGSGSDARKTVRSRAPSMVVGSKTPSEDETYQRNLINQKKVSE